LARNAGDLSTACAQLKSATEAEALAVVCDVTQPDAADIIQAELQRAGLYLDVLINNAGAGISGPFLTYPPESVSKLIAVNIESVMRLTRAALPAMIKRQRGGILNVASLGGYVPGPNQAAYYASKAYVLSLTEALMHEVAGQGVRVMAIAPGPVETTFHKDMGADASAYRLLLPSLTPERVARSAYLGFIMGRRVVVPGIVNNALFVALRLFPHVFTVPIVAWLLKRIPKP
jgi:short-subunit dehydrogenase